MWGFVIALLLVVLPSGVNGAACQLELPVNSSRNGTTTQQCTYRVDFGQSRERLWSLSLFSEEPIQVVVMDANFVALQTLYSDLSEDLTLQETLCRRGSSDRLESVFYLKPIGAPDVDFTLSAFLLPGSQLFLDRTEHDVVGVRPHFFYALLESDWPKSLSAPLSVQVSSSNLDASGAVPFQLQVSWNGCPDMNLHDSHHQTLTFSTQGRMLILPSQFGTPRPDAVYIGVRPNPVSLAGIGGENASQHGHTVQRNISLTLSFADNFASAPIAVVQWALMLSFLILFAILAVTISTLILKPGVQRLRLSSKSNPSGAENNDELLEDDDEEDGRLGDRRTRGRAKAYLWMIVLGGLFYLLPSLQTANSEATTMLSSGNRDTCYFNEQCMFPLQTFGPYGVTWWAANNVLSNTGYLLMAILLYSWTMFCKRHWPGKQTVLRVVSLPHDYTLFYCLAVALFYEGLMSSTYHICPTRLIFTIDTAFMFVGSVLISLETYRKWFRSLPHPMFPFSLLSILMIFNYFGTFLDIYKADFPSQSDLIYQALWAVLFVLGWCAVTIVITIRHRKRMPRKVLVLMMFVNCAFGFLPLLSFGRFSSIDRSTLLLGVALGTALFNLFAYVLGTFRRVDLLTRLFRLFLGTIVMATAIPAMYFFANTPSNKALAPWLSRELNAPCYSSGFYDEHDIWHLLSAVALGLTILMLMHAGEESGLDSGYSQTFISSSSSSKKKKDAGADESTPLI